MVEGYNNMTKQEAILNRPLIASLLRQRQAQMRLLRADMAAARAQRQKLRRAHRAHPSDDTKAACRKINATLKSFYVLREELRADCTAFQSLLSVAKGTSPTAAFHGTANKHLPQEYSRHMLRVLYAYKLWRHPDLGENRRTYDLDLCAIEDALVAWETAHTRALQACNAKQGAEHRERYEKMMRRIEAHNAQVRELHEAVAKPPRVTMAAINARLKRRRKEKEEGEST